MQRIGNIASIYAEQEKKKRNQQIITIGAIIAFGAVALVIVLKKS
jgi:hypothetical protein